MKKTKINKGIRYVLLDTNIISSLGNPTLAEKILELIREAVESGFGVAISDITYLELLSGIQTKKEAEIFAILKDVTRFYCRVDELIAAGRIGSFYKEHTLPMDQFDMGDRIISATAILHNCLIMTKNGRDFPQPFFKEVGRKMVEYTSKEYPVCVPVYLVEPQLEYIGSYHSKRMEKVVGKED